jgi:FcoT-like thioesterase domain
MYQTQVVANDFAVEVISDALLTRFLAPYKEDCQYLKKAVFNSLDHCYSADISDSNRFGFATGEFAIPESCYIRDTGHFNSVEFNICVNQLFYVMFAHLLQYKLLKEFSNWDLENFEHLQLSNFLIVKLASTFRKPMNSDRFKGELYFNKCSVRSNMTILKVFATFYDAAGRSEGELTVAILHEGL